MKAGWFVPAFSGLCTRPPHNGLRRMLAHGQHVVHTDHAPHRAGVSENESKARVDAARSLS